MILYIYDSTTPIQLKIDVNDFVIGIYFTQKYDNKKHPIIYYLKKMSKIKQNYDIHDKILFMIIKIFKQWQQYCKKIPRFDVYINYKNL